MKTMKALLLAALLLVGTAASTSPLLAGIHSQLQSAAMSIMGGEPTPTINIACGTLPCDCSGTGC